MIVKFDLKTPGREAVAIGEEDDAPAAVTPRQRSAVTAPAAADPDAGSPARA